MIFFQHLPIAAREAEQKGFRAISCSRVPPVTQKVASNVIYVMNLQCILFRDALLFSQARAAISIFFSNFIFFIQCYYMFFKCSDFTAWTPPEFGYTQSGKSVHRSPETQNTMGRRAFGKSEKSVQNHANQHGTLCASNHLCRFLFGVFYGWKIRKHIVDTASIHLFWMIFVNNTMGHKFHHNYSQSEATNHRVQGRMQLMQSKQTDCHDWHVPSRRISASPCPHAWQGECWPLASSTQGCCHPDRPASDDCCVCLLWRTQLGSGKVSSSNSSSRNRRTSSSSSSRDKTKQGKTRQHKAIQLTHFRPYSGDTPAIP